MADPLSIAASAIAVATTITSITKTVTTFVGRVREARKDLDAVKQELVVLQSTLELLSQDLKAARPGSTPDTLLQQIRGILASAGKVVDQIGNIVKGCDAGNLQRAARWIMSGQRERVNIMRQSLISHNAALSIALDLLAISLTRQIDCRTEAMSIDIVEIRASINRLESMQTSAPIVRCDEDSLLQRYLDGLTTYAESVQATSGLETDSQRSHYEIEQQTASELDISPQSPALCSAHDFGSMLRAREKPQGSAPRTPSSCVSSYASPRRATRHSEDALVRKRRSSHDTQSSIAPSTFIQDALEAAAYASGAMRHDRRNTVKYASGRNSSLEESITAEDLMPTGAISKEDLVLALDTAVTACDIDFICMFLGRGIVDQGRMNATAKWASSHNKSLGLPALLKTIHKLMPLGHQERSAAIDRKIEQYLCVVAYLMGLTSHRKTLEVTAEVGKWHWAHEGAYTYSIGASDILSAKAVEDSLLLRLLTLFAGPKTSHSRPLIDSGIIEYALEIGDFEAMEFMAARFRRPLGCFISTEAAMKNATLLELAWGSFNLQAISAMEKLAKNPLIRVTGGLKRNPELMGLHYLISIIARIKDYDELNRKQRIRVDGRLRRVIERMLDDDHPRRWDLALKCPIKYRQCSPYPPGWTIVLETITPAALATRIFLESPSLRRFLKSTFYD